MICKVLYGAAFVGTVLVVAMIAVAASAEERIRLTDKKGNTVGYIDSYAGRDRVTDKKGKTLYWIERERDYDAPLNDGDCCKSERDPDESERNINDYGTDYRNGY